MQAMHERGISSRKIKVDKAKLLETIKENRAKHVAAYKEAVEGYRDELKEKLAEQGKKFLDFAGNIREGSTLEDMAKHPTGMSRLPQPESYEKAYDYAISMLEMDLATEVEITTAEHACWVMDDWDWKTEFHAQNLRYSKMA